MKKNRIFLALLALLPFLAACAAPPDWNVLARRHAAAARVLASDVAAFAEGKATGYSLTSEDVATLADFVSVTADLRGEAEEMYRVSGGDVEKVED